MNTKNNLKRINILKDSTIFNLFMIFRIKNISLFAIVMIFIFASVHSHAFGVPYQSVEKPVTSAKLFRECNTENQKPGTEISSLCKYWDQHIAYLESQLDKVCDAAGEKIYKKVNNVEGVYLKNPGIRLLHLRKDEDGARSYSSPATHRAYRFVEFSRGHGSLKHSEISDIKPGKRYPSWKTSSTTIDNPTAQYQISHEILTDKSQQAQGFFGDKTVISDRTSGEIFAERIIYYYFLKNGITTSDGQRLSVVGNDKDTFDYLVPCDNYVPKLFGFEERYPTSAYEFVSRVLIPKPWSDEERIALFDLTKGIKQKRKRCVSFVRFGPDITLDNLTARIESEHWGHLHLGIKGTDDVYTCENHFDGPKNYPSYYFSDGKRLSEEELLSHFNLKWSND